MEKYLVGWMEMKNESLLADAARTVRTAAAWGWEKATARFGAARPSAAPVEAPVPVRSITRAAAPATLGELGVPSNLAKEFELHLGLMGMAKPNGQISGFVFRTPDGVAHALRTTATDERSVDRAA